MSVISAALVALRYPWVGVMLWTCVGIRYPHSYGAGSAGGCDQMVLIAASIMHCQGSQACAI